MVNLADTLTISGHAYASKYRAWVESVKQRQKDVNDNCEKYKKILEEKCEKTGGEALSIFKKNQIFFYLFCHEAKKSRLGLLTRVISDGFTTHWGHNNGIQ